MVKIQIPPSHPCHQLMHRIQTSIVPMIIAYLVHPSPNLHPGTAGLEPRPILLKWQYCLPVQLHQSSKPPMPAGSLRQRNAKALKAAFLSRQNRFSRMSSLPMHIPAPGKWTLLPTRPTLTSKKSAIGSTIHGQERNVKVRSIHTCYIKYAYIDRPATCCTEWYI